MSHGNYGPAFAIIHSPKVSGTPPEIYTSAARIGGTKAHPAIVSICDSPHDRFIYLRIINARPTLIPIKNERILRDTFARHVYQ